MLSIGIVVGLLGYGMTFWGAQLWSGCSSNSFLDIMWPGGARFSPCGGPNGPVNQYNANNTGTQANGLPSGSGYVTTPSGQRAPANIAPPGAGQG